MLNMTPVESSNIESVGYFKDNKILHVKFLNGSHYIYKDVDEETYDQLLQAESQGKFLNSVIKGHFTYERIA